MKRIWLFMILTLASSACDKGDALGSLERGARALFKGWDMWKTEAVSPYNPPLVSTPQGTVPLFGQEGLASAAQAAKQMSQVARNKQAKLAYRRYCQHCHGSSGDGRSIVGESFSVVPTDLRSEMIQQQEDEDLYDLIADGGGKMLALQSTMTSLEIILSIYYLRSLKNAPSKPYFAPQNVHPLR